jgi:hypothetical protein
MTTLIFNSNFAAFSTIISTLVSTRTIAIDRQPVRDWEVWQQRKKTARTLTN